MTSGKQEDAECLSPTDSKEVSRAWGELCRIRNDSVGSVSISHGRAILDLHKELVNCARKTGGTCTQREQVIAGEKSYYWEIKQCDKQAHFELEFAKDRAVICSLLYALPLDLRAVCIDNVVRVYSEKLLRLGQRSSALYSADPESAKRWKESKERQLLIEMVSEFRNDHILSVALGIVKGSQVVLGSMGVVHGFGNRRILQTIGYDGVEKCPASSIPTNFSLKFEVSAEAEARLSNVEEEEVSELTRLCVFRNRLNDYATDPSGILRSLYTAIPRVVQRSHNIKFFEFNSKRKLLDSLVGLGYPIIIGGYNVDYTKGVLTKVLGDYFKDNANLLIPQFLDFNSTLELSYKFERILTKGNGKVSG